MIARDGMGLIVVGLALTGMLTLAAARWDSRWLFGASLLFGTLTLFTVFFFRDPERNVPHEPHILVAPADGRIIAIKHLDNHPFIGGKAVQISIFLSVFDVHINRIPTDGTVEYVKYNPGKFLAAFNDKASDLNEQTEIGMTTEGGRKIVFKQIAGLIARRIVCRLREGDKVAAGDRFGMIRFGSRTDLIIPADSRINVQQGESVRGGTTIIGYINTGDPIGPQTISGEVENVEL